MDISSTFRVSCTDSHQWYHTFSPTVPHNEIAPGFFHRVFDLWLSTNSLTALWLSKEPSSSSDINQLPIPRSKGLLELKAAIFVRALTVTMRISVWPSNIAGYSTVYSIKNNAVRISSV